MRIKLIAFTCFLLALDFPSFSQERVQTCIDLYIGGPQLRPTYANYDFTYVRARGYGPYGGRVEFFPAKRHSIGFEVNYLQINFSSPYPFYVRENNYKNGINTTNYTISKTRIYVRYAYHMVQNERVDFFCHVGIGAAIWSPNEVAISEDNNTNGMNIYHEVSYKNLLPIAIRTGIGVRVYINKYVGFNADMGIGGALLSGGLTVRIPGNYE